MDIFRKEHRAGIAHTKRSQARKKFEEGGPDLIKFEKAVDPDLTLKIILGDLDVCIGIYSLFKL